MKKSELVNALKKLEIMVLQMSDRDIIDLWNQTHLGEDAKLDEAISCRKVMVWSKAVELRVRIEMNLED